MPDTTRELLGQVLDISLDSEDLHAELQAIQDRIREALDAAKPD